MPTPKSQNTLFFRLFSTTAPHPRLIARSKPDPFIGGHPGAVAESEGVQRRACERMEPKKHPPLLAPLSTRSHYCSNKLALCAWPGSGFFSCHFLPCAFSCGPSSLLCSDLVGNVSELVQAGTQRGRCCCIRKQHQGKGTAREGTPLLCLCFSV